MIKAVFFDIDGTLMSHNTSSVPKSAQTALRLLKEKGILVFTATGRHMLEMKFLPIPLEYFDGHVTLNGQLNLDAAEKILFEAPIPEEDLKNALKLYEANALPFVLVQKDQLYINFVDDRVRAIQESVSSPLPPVKAYEGGPVYLFVAYGDNKQLTSLIQVLPHCKMTHWNDCGVDIVAKSGGKAVGIAKILEYFSLKPEEVMVFGDGENDIDMFHSAGLSVAMGNADPEVKKHASYVTTDVDDDGILNALRHFEIL